MNHWLKKLFVVVAWITLVISLAVLIFIFKIDWFLCEQPNYPDNMPASDGSDVVLADSTTLKFQFSAGTQSLLLPVNLHGQKVGEVEVFHRRVIFRTLQGKDYLIWEYPQDYSSISKVTLIPVRNTIQVFTRTALLVDEHYVAEFDLKNMEAKKFLLSCSS